MSRAQGTHAYTHFIKCEQREIEMRIYAYICVTYDVCLTINQYILYNTSSFVSFELYRWKSSPRHVVKRVSRFTSKLYSSFYHYNDAIMSAMAYVSNHQPHDCLVSRSFRRISKKTSMLRVTGFCAGNSRLTDEFPAQRASNAENVSIWWRHYVS